MADDQPRRGLFRRNRVEKARSGQLVSQSPIQMAGNLPVPFAGAPTGAQAGPPPADVQEGMQQAGMGSQLASFGPGGPIAPFFGYNKQARVWDFPTGYNIAARPRSTSGKISFDTIRSIFQTYDIARICLEHRADTMRGLEYNVLPVKGLTGVQAKDDIQAAYDFLESPDGINTFEVWQSMYLEDMLRYDAATLYKRRNRAGKLIGLDIVDGTTIAPVIDIRGRTPDGPAPAYVQFIQGMPAMWFTKDELIYQPFRRQPESPYGLPPVEWALLTINTDIRWQWHFLNAFTEGTLPDTFMEAPPDASDPETIAKFQELWDQVMEGDQAQKHKVRWIPSGAKPTPAKSIEQNVEFPTFMLKKMCAAFKVTPSEIGFTDHGNRSSGEAQQNVQYRVSITPLALHLSKLVTRILQKELGLKVRFEYLIGDEDEDKLSEAQQHDVYVRMGAESVDEVRLGLGYNDVNPDKVAPRIMMVGNQLIPVDKLGELEAQPLQQPGAPAPGADESSPDPGGMGDKGPASAPPPPGGEPGKSTTPPKGFSGAQAKPPMTKALEPPGPTQPASASPALSGETLADLRRWRSNSLTRVKRGTSPRMFEGGTIPEPVLERVWKTLSQASTRTGVDLAFEPVLKVRPTPPEGARDWPGWEIDLRIANHYTPLLVRALAALVDPHAAAEKALSVVSKAAKPHYKWLPADGADTTELGKALESLYTEAFAAGLDVADVVQGVKSVNWDNWTPGSATAGKQMAGPGLSSLLEQAAVHSAGLNVLRSIADTRLNELGDVIAKGLADGLNVHQLTQQLQGILDDPTYASMVARTETIRGMNAAAAQSYADAGVASKSWLTAMDDRVCSRCYPNEEVGDVPVNATFPSGQDAPPAHPNCRCALVPGTMTRSDAQLSGDLVDLQKAMELSDPAPVLLQILRKAGCDNPKRGYHGHFAGCEGGGGGGGGGGGATAAELKPTAPGDMIYSKKSAVYPDKVFYAIKTNTGKYLKYKNTYTNQSGQTILGGLNGDAKFTKHDITEQGYTPHHGDIHPEVSKHITEANGHPTSVNTLVSVPKKTKGVPGEGMPGFKPKTEAPPMVAKEMLPKVQSAVKVPNAASRAVVKDVYSGAVNVDLIVPVKGKHATSAYGLSDGKTLVVESRPEGIYAKLHDGPMSSVPGLHVGEKGAGELPKSQSYIKASSFDTRQAVKELYAGDVQIVASKAITETQTIARLSNGKNLAFSSKPTGMYASLISDHKAESYAKGITQHPVADPPSAAMTMSSVVTEAAKAQDKALADAATKPPMAPDAAVTEASKQYMKGLLTQSEYHAIISAKDPVAAMHANGPAENMLAVGGGPKDSVPGLIPQPNSEFAIAPVGNDLYQKYDTISGKPVPYDGPLTYDQAVASGFEMAPKAVDGVSLHGETATYLDALPTGTKILDQESGKTYTKDGHSWTGSDGQQYTSHLFIHPETGLVSDVSIVKEPALPDLSGIGVGSSLAHMPTGVLDAMPLGTQIHDAASSASFTKTDAGWLANDGSGDIIQPSDLASYTSKDHIDPGVTVDYLPSAPVAPAALLHQIPDGAFLSVDGSKYAVHTPGTVSGSYDLYNSKTGKLIQTGVPPKTITTWTHKPPEVKTGVDAINYKLNGTFPDRPAKATMEEPLAPWEEQLLASSHDAMNPPETWLPPGGSGPHSMGITAVDAGHGESFKLMQGDKQLTGTMTKDQLVQAGWSKDVATTEVKHPYAEPPKLSLADFTQKSGAKGSNPGGLFTEKQWGTEYYIKAPKTELHAQNEVLANKLYEAAGVKVADVSLIDLHGGFGKQLGVASKIEDGKGTLGQVGNLDKTAAEAHLRQGFAMDALLANHDVIGMGKDNILVQKAGSSPAIRIDNGGALMFRAQGGAKVGFLGSKDVTELKSMRDAGTNPDAASVYGKMTEENVKNSIQDTVAKLSPQKIDELVHTYVSDTKTAKELTDTLIARRESMLKQYNVADPFAGHEAKLSEPKAKAAEPVASPGYSLEVGTKITSAAHMDSLPVGTTIKAVGFPTGYEKMTNGKWKAEGSTKAFSAEQFDHTSGSVTYEIAGGPGTIGHLKEPSAAPDVYHNTVTGEYAVKTPEGNYQKFDATTGKMTSHYQYAPSVENGVHWVKTDNAPVHVLSAAKDTKVFENTKNPTKLYLHSDGTATFVGYKGEHSPATEAQIKNATKGNYGWKKENVAADIKAGEASIAGESFGGGLMKEYVPPTNPTHWVNAAGEIRDTKPTASQSEAWHPLDASQAKLVQEAKSHATAPNGQPMQLEQNGSVNKFVAKMNANGTYDVYKIGEKTSTQLPVTKEGLYNVAQAKQKAPVYENMTLKALQDQYHYTPVKPEQALAQKLHADISNAKSAAEAAKILEQFMKGGSKLPLNPIVHATDPAGVAWANKAFSIYGSSSGSSIYTPSEKSTLQSYTGSMYAELNKTLRSGGTSPKTKNMDSAMAKTPMPEDVVVHRGTAGFFVNNKVVDPKTMIGKIVEDPGYISTSVGSTPAFGGGTHIVFTVPKGTPVAYVKPFSHYSSERELVIGRGMRYVVTKVEGKKVYVTILPPEAQPKYT